jgi:hypothetical protein
MTNKTWNKLLKKNNYTQKAGAKSKNTHLNTNKIKFKLEYKI